MNTKFINIPILSIWIFIYFFPMLVWAQGDDYYTQKFLIEEVENPNPDYMPHVGFGYGMFGYLGEVKNEGFTLLSGKPGAKINVNFFLDKNHHTKMNLYVLTLGKLEGNKYEFKGDNLQDQNLNFQTDLNSFGLNVHYDFDHWIKKRSYIRPFVSFGAEFVLFSSKTDLSTRINNQRVFYNYWSDGTIRDIPEAENRPGRIINRDFDYETDIKGTDLYKAGTYNQWTFAFPLDLGLEFKVSERTRLRLATSYHYTLTDFLDGLSTQTTPKGESGSDAFTYTYLSLHLDLFSDDETILLNKLFADVENFDYALIDDEDGDLVSDINDMCLKTPQGIEVDTTGCPFDDDLDGVPNHIDKETSNPGAIVDNEGREIPDNLIWENLNMEGIYRAEVPLFLEMMNRLAASNSRRQGKIDIPEKFKSVDADNDGFISFDEVLKTIDKFFDYEVDFTTEDVYELNELFFAQ